MSITLHTPTEADWLQRRKAGIGASEAAVVLGLSDWKSPYQLWAEKTGLLEADDISDREPVEWGHRLQEPIRLAFQERSGRITEPWPEYTVAAHPERPWMLCTPDASQSGENGKGPGLLQIKTTGAWYAKDWSDEPPLGYQVQLQHELEVVGADWGTLAVLIGGQRLKWFDMERHPKLIEGLVKAEAEFWRRVQENDPPPPDYRSPHTATILQKLHPADNGESLLLPPEAMEWDRHLQEIKAAQKELESQKTEVENQLRAALGDATYGVLPDGGTYSWKTQTNKGYTVAEKTYRVLRRMK